MKLPQLSLRELFLLVVIAAMGCGWWVERRDRKGWEYKAKTMIEYWEWAGGNPLPSAAQTGSWACVTVAGNCV